MELFVVSLSKQIYFNRVQKILISHGIPAENFSFFRLIKFNLELF